MSNITDYWTASYAMENINKIVKYYKNKLKYVTKFYTLNLYNSINKISGKNRKDVQLWDMQ